MIKMFLKHTKRSFRHFPQILYEPDIYPTLFTIQSRSKSAKAKVKTERITVDIADSAEEDLIKDDFKAKKHPGVMNLKRTEIPEIIMDNIKTIIKTKTSPKNLEYTSREFFEILANRRLPIEKAEYREIYSKVATKVEEKDQVMLPFLSKDQKIELDQKNEQKIKSQLRRLVYHWEPIVYDENACLNYLAARSPLEYSVIHRVLSEISTRDPSFEPKTLFDFGSGVGTVMWAAHKVWPKVIQENYCVDTSSDMHDLAEHIIRAKSSDKTELLYRGVFYRQFMPSPRHRTYDLVVSSFSMLDLPSASTRLDIINNLWQMTSKYLVLIDYGTPSGFSALNQARDFIIRPDRKDDFVFKNHKFRSPAHIFAPCPHDEFCPRFLGGYKACKFPIKYKNLLPFSKDITSESRFCYFVIKKEERDRYDEQWPRIVEVPLVRGRHTICRLCTSEGKICEAIFTRFNPSREMYRCARKSMTGDLLPIKKLESKELNMKPLAVEPNENDKDPDY